MGKAKCKVHINVDHYLLEEKNGLMSKMGAREIYFAQESLVQ
jgi:hypothetical protein